MSEEYQRAGKALARETEMNSASAARIEQALLRAMASRDDRRVSWPGWMPVAAAILLIAGAGALMVWQTNRSVVPDDTAAVPAVTKPNASAMSAIEKVTKPAPLVVTAAATGRPSRPSGKTSRRATVVNPTGFVELPWTGGLPAFESGEIVRMDVPVASLPAYGIDISAGADRPVEADILIGQDGFARAIRLVTNSARSLQ